MTFRRLAAACAVSISLLAGGFAGLPVHAQVDPGLNQVGETIGLSAQDPREIAANIINIVLGFLGIILLLIVLYAGFLWMTAGGDAAKVEKAKAWLRNAVIGLIIILSSWAIATYVIGVLLNATGAGGGGSGGGGGGSGGGGFGGGGTVGFRIVGESPTGSQTKADLVIRILFSDKFDPAGLAGMKIVPAVNGLWSVDPSEPKRAVFNALNACPGFPQKNDCFAFDTSYTVTVPDSFQTTQKEKIKCSAGFGSKPCVFSFISGHEVDSQPPTVNINTLYDGKNVPVDTAIEVGANATDDTGISGMSWFEDNQLFTPDGTEAPSDNTKDFTATRYWDTLGKTLKQVYAISVKSTDLDSNTGSKTVNVTVLAVHCFNDKQDKDETGKDCGGVDCKACTGSVCTSNSDCSSGVCQNGICVEQPIITKIDPAKGRPGTYVSIWGDNFGDAGKVYFVGPPEVEAQAPLACVSSGVKTWTNHFVLVQLPDTAATGPIRLLNSNSKMEDRTDDDRGPKLTFTVNNQEMPGVCSVKPDNGKPGITATLEGTGFGSSKGSVGFGNSAITQNVNWSSGAKVDFPVPVLSPGLYPAWIRTANGLNSNKVPFTVNSPDSAQAPPVITAVDPAKGPRGEYITIIGQRFGSEPSVVYFHDKATGTDVPGDSTFPNGCGKNWWSDTSIVIKVPDAAAKIKNFVAPAQFSIFLQRKDGVFSAKPGVDFEYTDGQAGPGICTITPNAGPAKTTQVTLVGERFGSQGNGSSVVFHSGKTAGTSGWQAGEIITTVPDAAQTGPVTVKTGGKVSNAVQFKVADCRVESNVCAQGQSCCGDGSCVTGTCPKISFTAMYAWQFSTGVIPKAPSVVESCDASGQGQQPPSPTPWVHQQGGDQVCVSTKPLIGVLFDMEIDWPSNPSSLFKLKKCVGTGVDPCEKLEEVAITVPTKTDINNQGVKQSYVTFKPSGDWKDTNKLYYVLLSDKIKSADLQFGDSMQERKDCPEPNSGYCFQFRTRADAGNCQVAKIFVNPFVASVQGGEAQKYDALPAAKDAVCNLLDCEDMSFDWSTDPMSKAQVEVPAFPNTINGCHQTVRAGMQEAVVPPVKIRTQLTGSNPAIFGTGDLSIKFITPQIVDRFPECTTACSNIWLWAQFNTALNPNSVTPKTVNVLRCDNENCLPSAQHEVPITVEVWQNSWLKQYGGKDQFKDSFVKIVPQALQKGTYYIVRFKGGDPSASVSSKYGVLLPKPVEWKFRTRLTNEVCKPDSVTVVPALKIESKIGDRELFSAAVLSAPDECRPEGQTLLSNDAFTWDLPNDPNRKIAKIVHPYENGLDADGVLPQGCTDRCLASGSEGVFGAVAQCGNGKVETTDDLYCVNGKTPADQACVILPMISGAGEQCDGGSRCDAESCLWISVANIPNGTCGNGTVDNSAGEMCDPGYRCGGIPATSTEVYLNDAPCADQASVDKCLAAKGTCAVYDYLGCSYDCRHLGASSVQGTTCGEGTIGLGEDCDQGPNNGKGGCSPNCLHVGSKKGVGSVCGNGKIEPGETCETGSQIPDFCDEKTCRKKGLAACAKPSDANCCGNNNPQEKSKECDDGNHVDGDGCSQICLLEGSSWNYKVPSFCGDGILGVGEACENGADSVKVSSGLKKTGDVTGAGNGRSDNRQLFEVVGMGTPDENNELKTDVQCTYSGVSGKAEYGVMCGHTDEKECPVGYGLDDYGCCSLRPIKESMSPAGAGANNQGYCRNALLKVKFDKTTPMDIQSVVGNFVIAKQLDVQQTKCPEGTTELAENSTVPQGFVDWVAYQWHVLISWFQGQPAQAVWCTQMVSGALTAKGGTSTTEFIYRLSKPLDANSTYIVRMKGDADFSNNGSSASGKTGIKTLRGVVAKNDVGTDIVANTWDYSWYFKTGEDICLINSIDVEDMAEENPGLFRKTGESHLFQATARSLHNGIPEEISQTDVYSWSWIPWIVNDDTIADHADLPGTELPVSMSVIQAKGKNGSALVFGLLKVTEDKVTQGASTKGMVLEGALPITVFVCDHPWPTTLPFAPFQDTSASALFKQADGKSFLPGYTENSAYYYFQTMYCRDRSNGVLPNMEAHLVTPSDSDKQSGMLRQYLFTFTDAQYMHDGIGIRVYANPYHDSPMQWYQRRGFVGKPQTLKVDDYEAVQDGNTMYVGFPNTKGMAENIYQNILVFSHNPDASPMTQEIFKQMVDNLIFNINFGFDNTNVCVKGGETGKTAGEPYISSEAGVTAPKVCVSDLDCLALAPDLRCASFKYKLRHDLQRLEDFKKITESAEEYWTINKKYPVLSEGTFLPSRTNSRWPSWQETLGSALGMNLPIDPVNRFLTCGYCQDVKGENKTKVPCAVDKDCPTASPVCGMAEGYDAKTCWNAAQRVFKCPYMDDKGETPATAIPMTLEPFAASRFYAYKAFDGGKRFELGANFEIAPRTFDNDGNPTNWWYPPFPKEIRQCYTKSILSNGRMCTSNDDCKPCLNPQAANCTEPAPPDNPCKPVGFRWQFKNICQNDTLGETSICGDGILGPNETCELGTTNIASCDVVAPGADDGFKLQVCQECKGYADDPNLSECRLKQECGNGIVDGLCAGGPSQNLHCSKDSDCTDKQTNTAYTCALKEVCDDGALNGTYGKCKKDCMGYDKFCGDGKLNPGEDCDLGADNGKWCDNQAQMCTKSYVTAVPFTNSCGNGCKGRAPFCGDGKTDSPDEQCDGNTMTTAKAICNKGDREGLPCDSEADCPMANPGLTQCGMGIAYNICGGCIGEDFETNTCEGVTVSRCSTGAKVCANFPDGPFDFTTAGLTPYNKPCKSDSGCDAGQHCISLSNGINCNVNGNAQGTGNNPQCSTVGSTPASTLSGTCRAYATEHVRTCNAPGTIEQCRLEQKWSKCKIAHGCGDGVIDQGEECDDGSGNAYFNACLPSCRKNTCGDGYALLNVEECDKGPDNGKATCDAQYGSTCNDCSGQCKLMAKAGGYCGNGIKETGEQCDGNVVMPQLTQTVLDNANYIYAENIIGSGTVDKAKSYVSAVCDHPPCQVMTECGSDSGQSCSTQTKLTCQQLGYDFAINDTFIRSIQVTDWSKAGINKYIPVISGLGVNFWYEPPEGMPGFIKLTEDKNKNAFLNKVFWDCGLLRDDDTKSGPADMIWVQEKEWPTPTDFKKCVNRLGLTRGFKVNTGIPNSKPTCSSSCKPAGCGRCSEEPGDGKIFGYVMDRVWMQAVPGARVTLQYRGVNVDQVMTDVNGRFDFSSLNSREECGQYRLVIDKNDDNVCTSKDDRPVGGCLTDIAPDFIFENVDEGARGGYWPFTTDDFSIVSYPWQEMMGMIFINPRPAKGEGYVTYGRPTWIDSEGWENLKNCPKGDSQCALQQISFSLPWSPRWAPHVVWPTNQARFAASFNSRTLYSGLQSNALTNNQVAYQQCSNYAARGTEQAGEASYKGFVCARDYNWQNQGSMDMANPPYTGVMCPHLKWDFVGGCPIQGTTACIDTCMQRKGGWNVLADWGYSFPNITQANCESFCKLSTCFADDWSMRPDFCTDGITSGQVTAYFRYANPQKFDQPISGLTEPIELYFSGPEYEPMRKEYYFTAALTDSVVSDWVTKGIKPPAYVSMGINVPVPYNRSWREYWAKTRTYVYVTTEKGIETIRSKSGVSTRQDFRSPFWHLASVMPNGTINVQNKWMSLWSGASYNTLNLPKGGNGNYYQPESDSSIQYSPAALRPPGLGCWNNFGAACKVWNKNSTIPAMAVCWNGSATTQNMSILNFVEPAQGKTAEDFWKTPATYGGMCKDVWNVYGLPDAKYGYTQNVQAPYLLQNPYLMYNQINW